MITTYIENNKRPYIVRTQKDFTAVGEKKYKSWGVERTVNGKS